MATKSTMLFDVLANILKHKSIDEYKMKIQEQYKQAKEIYDIMDKKTTVKEIDELITKLHEIEERIKRFVGYSAQ